MNPGTSQYRRKAVTLLWVCTSVFVGGNLFVVPMMDEITPRDWLAVFVYGWFGAIVAQGGLHSIWCVFAPVANSTRLRVAIVAALFWCGAWAVGFLAAISDHPHEIDDFWKTTAAILLCLPLIVIAIQAPLWLARFWFRWRIRHAGDGPVEVGATPLRIRHVMLGTAAVALALGMARLAEAITDDSDLLIGVVVGALCTLLSSLLIILPVLVATLRVRRLWLSLSAIALLGCVFYAGMMSVGTMMFGRPSPEDAFGMAVTIGSLYICLAGVLLVLRRLGYRLEWGRSVSSVETTQD